MKKSMHWFITHLYPLLGAGLLVYGVWLIHAPLALIVAGGLVLLDYIHEGGTEQQP